MKKKRGSAYGGKDSEITGDFEERSKILSESIYFEEGNLNF